MSPCQAVPAPVRRGNQGQIPAVYSRSLCQLLRKSEQMPQERSGYNECGNGSVLVVRGESVRLETGGFSRHADSRTFTMLSNTRGEKTARLGIVLGIPAIIWCPKSRRDRKK